MGRLFSGHSAFFIKMGVFDKSFQKLNLKDMYQDAVYHGKDRGGNFIYVPQWLQSKFAGSETYKTDFAMNTAQGKALALRVVQPLAMVADRCGSMIRNGKYYVVDENDNEKPSFKDIVNILNRPNPMQSHGLRRFAKDNL